MNKKGKAIFGAIGTVLFCGQAIHAIEPTTIGNLSETSVKISGIDMNKDFGKAGNILDSFYTGTFTKGKAESSVVYANQNAVSEPAVPVESICNAKSSKIVLSGKVPPPTSATKEKRERKDSLPLGSGALAAGALVLGIAARKAKSSRGYFDNYAEDAQTVWNFIKPSSSSNNSNTDPYPPPSSTPPNPYEVHPSGGPVTCVGDSCGLP